MKMLVAATLLASATIAVAAPTAEAMRRGGDNAVQQSRAKLKKEWARARAVGGYANPFQFLFGFLDDDRRAAQIQPSFTSSTAQDPSRIR
ncbi:MAG: hypothetical protein AAF074_18095 [Pseudomonadota bacterium]